MSESKTQDYYRGYYDGFQDAKRSYENVKVNPNPPDIGRWPVGPGIIEAPEIKCQQCGMMWRGVMGYVCPRMDCHIQPKTIAASSNKENL